MPSELEMNLSVVYGNMILAYATFYMLPMIAVKLKNHRKELKERNEMSEAMNKLAMENFEQLKNDPRAQAIIQENIRQNQNFIREMEAESNSYTAFTEATLEALKDLDGKNANLLRDTLVPAMVILFAMRNYKKAALLLHAANGFLQPHFTRLDDTDEFVLVFGPTSIYVCDIISTLLALIPHRYWQMLSQIIQQIAIYTILRPKEFDPQMAFMDACVRGDKVNMKTILNKYANKINVNARQGVTGNTGLHIACRGGHLNIVQSILDCERKNVKLNLENFSGFTPVELAANGGHRLIVMRLLKCKNMKLNSEQVEKIVRTSTMQEFYQIAKMILADFKRRTGMDFDQTLGTYINRIDECIRKKDSKSLDIYKKAIHAWFTSRNMSKMELNSAAKKSKEEIWQDFQDHFECSICYEEFNGGEIYSCENDHWICLSCKKSWTISCPSCRVDFGENGPVRRYKAEKMLKDFLALRKIMEEKPHNA